VFERNGEELGERTLSKLEGKNFEDLEEKHFSRIKRVFQAITCNLQVWQ
jgi:hypothetical protein